MSTHIITPVSGAVGGATSRDRHPVDPMPQHRLAGELSGAGATP